MKTRALMPLLALLLLLSACAPAPVPTPIPSAEAVETQSPPPESPAPETPPVPENPLPLDYDALEAGLPEELREAFSGFLPVLRDNAPFSWTFNEETGEVKTTTLEGFRLRNSDVGQVYPMELERLTLLDLDGDGSLELILGFRDWGYYYLIFKQEGNSFYGLEQSYRAFEMLQSNGVFVGSGGAADSDYLSLSFADGVFSVNTLGTASEWTGSEAYTIDGRSVSAGEFESWRGELMVGDALWYSVEETGAENP